VRLLETIEYAKRVLHLKTAEGKFVTVDLSASAQRVSELKSGDQASAPRFTATPLKRYAIAEPCVLECMKLLWSESA
jgi:hypothetical protein